MRVSKPIAVLVGILTVWPLVYMVVSLAFVFGSGASLESVRNPADLFGGSALALMAVNTITTLIILALPVFYIVHVFKNPALGDRRWLWAAVLFFGNFIVMPVYWFLYMWRDVRGGVVPPRRIVPTPIVPRSSRVPSVHAETEKPAAAVPSAAEAPHVAVVSFNYRQDADLAVSMLIANGIQAYTSADDCGRVDPGLGFATRTSVLVPVAQAAAALALIKRAEHGSGESGTPR